MLKIKSPLACVWEITSCCNFFCPHCRAYSESSKDDPIIEKTIIRQLVENEILSVNISGGEPLLNPRIFDIVYGLTKNKIDVGISTNGFFLKDYVYSLIDAGISFVQISVDGPREIHDKFRGVDGAFDRAVESILLAKKMGLFVQMNTTITSQNMQYIFENITLAKKLGVDRVLFRRVVATGLASKNNVIPNKVEYINLIKSLLGYKYSCNDPTFINIDDPIISILDKGHFGGESISCSAGITSLGIDSLGNVFPCIFARSFIGNLMTDSLGEIWEKSPLLKQIREREIHICGECEYKTSCGGCRGADGILAWDHMCPLTNN